MTGVYTSASPTHALGPDHQGRCLNSWADAGYAIHTVNSRADEGKVPPSKAVQLWADRDASALYGKPYVFVDDVMRAGRDNEVTIITNSDIELRDTQGVLLNYIDKAKDGLVIAHRVDHPGNYTGKTYEVGIDLFIVHRNFYHLFPPTLFCIGQTWWDYWIPYRFIRSRLPILRVKEPILWHQSHAAQHNGQQWARMTQHFTWLEGIHHNKAPQQVTGIIHNEIKRHTR